ncbi:MAG: asparagine synthase (glutamine-hydrolyzing) [Candidatus Paracaedimonas acanthamoebae]|uniref:asparagine synthase (glutamine-hydrolyzing) n=1 Tax=Candidatus Paracaedimonas acanthamoebae TaxID=244581 RepID=A0A8J7PLW1_9PROT|nr:asparagine synthase (glutamine-hydrolyzing) [Candidatus Paracaedimonas acanthamoebae]
MCGIAGFLDFSRATSSDLMKKQISQMTASLSHRGPDDEGIWNEVEQGIALGMRRLAVQDLSPAGHQPMISKDGRYVIVYNGEIYNAPELRQLLEKEGFNFRGHSDTEVILEACARWGIVDTVSRLNGMFAFGLWDQKEKKLILVRDRLGIKPLYYGKIGKTLLFGSELKALLSYDKFERKLNPEALNNYFKYNFIPAPQTIYNDIYKLLPGTLIIFNEHGKDERKVFWDPSKIVQEGLNLRESKIYDDKSTIDELERLLKDSIKRQMIADVPLGAFLSGGVDSSTVVSILQSLSSSPIKTYSIGFEEEGFNEAENARIIAQYLKTDHHELILTPQDATSVISQLPKYFDEPFADASQIPTYLVSNLARKSVKVVLSGDGGDELFAGYNRHRIAARMQKIYSFLPLVFRNIIGNSIKLGNEDFWDRMIPSSLLPQAGDKLYKFANILKSKDAKELYEILLSQRKTSTNFLRNQHNTNIFQSENQFSNFMDSIQYWDLIKYLPDDILAKVDRASMAVSLEARVPLLDHRIVDLAWKLPLNMKIRDGSTKWILRQILYRYVPKGLVERPKMGFGIPLGKWLKGPLRDWGEEFISENRLENSAFFEVKQVRQMWQKHLQGQGNYQHQLWSILMFEAWKEDQENF